MTALTLPSGNLTGFINLEAGWACRCSAWRARGPLTVYDREIGTQVKGSALIALGRVAEGEKTLRDHRKRAMAAGFMYCRAGTDGPLGFAMFLQGNLVGGIRFLERLSTVSR